MKPLSMFFTLCSGALLVFLSTGPEFKPYYAYVSLWMLGASILVTVIDLADRRR